MNKIFAIIMSIQLMAAPVAFARDGDQFRENSDGKASSKYVNQITTLGTSIIGANVLTYCSMGAMKSSLVAFMSGSLTYILAEIVAGKKFKQVREASEKELKMLEEKMPKGGGDLQKATLEKALDKEKELLKFVEERIKWVTAVELMYLTATTLAVLEWISETPPLPTGIVLIPAGCVAKPIGLALASTVIGAYAALNFMEGGFIQTLLFSLVPIFELEVAVLYQYGINRSFTFGAASIFTGLVLKDLNEVKGTIKSNVKKLEHALAQFKEESKAENGIAAGNSDSNENGQNNPESQPGTITALPSAPEARTCAGRTSSGIVINPRACARPVFLTSPVLGADFNIPTLSNATTAATDASNALAAGNAASAEVSADGLISNAAKIRALNKNAVNKLNEVLKAKGKKPVDFNAESRKQAERMVASYNKAAQKAGGSPLANTKLGEATLSNESESIEATVTEPKTNTNSAIVSAIPSQLPYLEDPTLPENFESNSRPESLSTRLEEFDLENNDVSKNSGASIFKILSKRYLLNYTKLFERKKVDQRNEPQVESTTAPE